MELEAGKLYLAVGDEPVNFAEAEPPDRWWRATLKEMTSVKEY